MVKIASVFGTLIQYRHRLPATWRPNKTTHTYLGMTLFSTMSVTQTTPDVKKVKVHRKRGHRSFPKKER